MAAAGRGSALTSPGSVREDVIPLARPVLGEAEEQAVIEVLRSGRLSLGPRVEEFESRNVA